MGCTKLGGIAGGARSGRRRRSGWHGDGVRRAERGPGYNVSYNDFGVCNLLKTSGRKIGNSRIFGVRAEAGFLGRFAAPCGLRESLRQSGKNQICF